MLVNLVLFLWVAARYEYKALDKPRVHPPKAPRGMAPRWVRPRIVTGVSMVGLCKFVSLLIRRGMPSVGFGRHPDRLGWWTTPHLSGSA